MDCVWLNGCKKLEETAGVGYAAVEKHAQPLALIECGVHRLWPTVHIRLNLLEPDLARGSGIHFQTSQTVCDCGRQECGGVF